MTRIIIPFIASSLVAWLCSILLFTANNGFTEWFEISFFSLIYGLPWILFLMIIFINVEKIVKVIKSLFLSSILWFLALIFLLIIFYAYNYPTNNDLILFFYWTIVLMFTTATYIYIQIWVENWINFKIELRSGKRYTEWIPKAQYKVRSRQILIKLGLIRNNIYSEDIEYVWCLVGNLTVKEVDSITGRKGTKQFRNGAKLYCYPPLWGDGYENIKVIGIPRRTLKRITIIMPRKRISNFRIEKVYDPFIVKNMIENGGWDGSFESKVHAEELLNAIKDQDKQA